MVGTGQIVVGLCFLFSFATCALRFYLRVIVARQFLLQEFLLVFAFVLEVVFGGLQLQMYYLLSADQTVRNAVELNKLFFAGTFFYIGSLWSVKISINLLHIRLTRKIPRVHVWAIRSLYGIIFTWILVYVTYSFGCVPISRKWEAPLGHVKPCPPILREWDFWVHLALHICTDVWLCVLPFPVLIQITERRLRIAVFTVYGLAGVSLIVTIVRAALLAINAAANIKYIMILTMIELATCIVVGCLPGCSSTFTRKYVYSSSGGRTNSYYPRNDFSQIPDPSASGAQSSTELASRTHETVIGAAYSTDGCSSQTGSTENIIDPRRIKTVTTVSVTTG